MNNNETRSLRYERLPASRCNPGSLGTQERPSVRKLGDLGVGRDCVCNIQPRKGNERVVKQREMRGLAGRETVVALPDTEVVRQEGTIAAGIGQSRLGPEEQQARYMCGRLHHRCISARVLLLMNNEVGGKGKSD